VGRAPPRLAPPAPTASWPMPLARQ
jgi:hypothetical protein